MPVLEATYIKGIHDDDSMYFKLVKKNITPNKNGDADERMVSQVKNDGSKYNKYIQSGTGAVKYINQNKLKGEYTVNATQEQKHHKVQNDSTFDLPDLSDDDLWSDSEEDSDSEQENSDFDLSEDELEFYRSANLRF